MTVMRNAGGGVSGVACPSMRRKPLTCVSPENQPGVGAGIPRQLTEAPANLDVSVLVPTLDIPPGRLGVIPSNVATRPSLPQSGTGTGQPLHHPRRNEQRQRSPVLRGPLVVVPVGNNQPTAAGQVNRPGCGKVLDRRIRA